jgi:hypothetical protein
MYPLGDLIQEGGNTHVSVGTLGWHVCFHVVHVQTSQVQSIFMHIIHKLLVSNRIFIKFYK